MNTSCRSHILVERKRGPVFQPFVDQVGIHDGFSGKVESYVLSFWLLNILPISIHAQKKPFLYVIHSYKYHANVLWMIVMILVSFCCDLTKKHMNPKFWFSQFHPVCSVQITPASSIFEIPTGVQQVLRLN